MEITTEGNTITVNGITYVRQQEDKHTYPMMMETTSNEYRLIVEFTSEYESVVLQSSKYKVGSVQYNRVSHTDTKYWKPYNPTCDGKLNGYYVEASVEALCALKMLGYTAEAELTDKEIVDEDCVYIAVRNNEYHAYWNTPFESEPMQFKDGKFVTEPKPLGFVPKTGEEYYFIGYDLTVESESWYMRSREAKRLKRGHLHRTPENAKAVDNLLTPIRKLAGIVVDMQGDLEGGYGVYKNTRGEYTVSIDELPNLGVVQMHRETAELICKELNAGRLEL